MPSRSKSELVLSSATDEHARAAETDIAARLYLSLKREVNWIPRVYRNGLAVVDDREQREFLVTSLAESVAPKVGRVHLLSTSERMLDIEGVEAYEMTLSGLASALIHASSTVDEILDTCRTQGLLSPPARKFDLLILDVPTEDLIQLVEAEKTREALLKLLTLGMRARCPLFIVTDEARREMVPLLREINWGAYLGQLNVEFAEELYSDLEPGIFNPGRIRLGVLAAFDRKYLSVLQPLKYEASPWASMKKTQRKAEKQVYEDFLEELRGDED